MKLIGAHISAAGGVENAPKNAAEINATAFALFTKNQKQWFAPALSAVSIEAFKEKCAELNFAANAILPHDSYLINLGHPTDDGLQKSRNSFTDEMKRCEIRSPTFSASQPAVARRALSFRFSAGVIPLL